MSEICDDHGHPAGPAADQDRRDVQRRVPAGAGTGGRGPGQRPGRDAGRRACQTRRRGAPRLPAVLVRGGDHAVDPRPCVRGPRQCRRPLRAAQGGGVRDRSRCRRARRRRVHLRRADPHGRPGRRLAGQCGPVLGADPRLVPAGLVRRSRSGRLLLGRAVHQARVPGQRHRSRRAVVRAGAARAQPALARGGGARPGPGRAHGERAPAVPARHGGAKRRARDRAAAAHAGCGRALPDRSLEVLYAVGSPRGRLGAGQPRRRHPVRRAGACARHPQDLHPQGSAVLRLSRAVWPLRRRRPHCAAVPGHELHHLSLGLRDRPSRRPVRPGGSSEASTC